MLGFLNHLLGINLTAALMLETPRTPRTQQEQIGEL